MKIKKGDKVRVSSRVPRIYERFGSMIAPHYECKVVEIDDGMALLDSIPAKHIFLFPLKYLVKVDAEADAYEQIEEEYARFMGGRTPISFADRIEHEYIQRRMRRISQDDFLKEINPAEHEVTTKPHYVPKIMFNTEFWVKYEADLAKELAIAYGKRGKSPLDAVAVAKEITKRLKQK